jgi:chemotaxis protein methyltransferase CheR
MKLTDHDIELLLDDFIDEFGYDFTQYSRASLRRRIERLAMMDSIASLEQFRDRIKKQPDYFQRVVTEISVNVTEMFRDPQYFSIIREKVLPALAGHPLIRIWHAGASTGEEAYAMAILLQETGLLSRSLIYATDINPAVLKKAREGIFPLAALQQYSRNYMQSGGIQEFSRYYTAHYNVVKFNAELSNRMIFSTHNLVSDSSFNSFHLVMCRNVLIYFEKELQSRVLALFDRSLEKDGYLILGSKETIRFSGIAPNYARVSENMKIWRKIK